MNRAEEGQFRGREMAKETTRVRDPSVPNEVGSSPKRVRGMDQYRTNEVMPSKGGKKTPDQRGSATKSPSKRQKNSAPIEEDDLPSTKRKNFMNEPEEALPTYRDEDDMGENPTKPSQVKSQKISGKRQKTGSSPIKKQLDSSTQSPFPMAADVVDPSHVKLHGGSGSAKQEKETKKIATPTQGKKNVSKRNSKDSFDAREIELKERTSDMKKNFNLQGIQSKQKGDLDLDFNSMGGSSKNFGSDEKQKLIPNQGQDQVKPLNLQQKRNEVELTKPKKKKEVRFGSGLSSSPKVNSLNSMSHDSHKKDDQFIGYQYRFLNSIEKPELNLKPAYINSQPPSGKLTAEMKNSEEKVEDMVVQPKNQAVYFKGPRSNEEIDSQIFDYYVRNTYVRGVDVDEDPNTDPYAFSEEEGVRKLPMPQDEALIKDVRNIHVSSDHQRAYVWVLTWTKSPGSVVIASDHKRQLWMQVYSLASAWSSPSSLKKQHILQMQKLQTMRDELFKLEQEFAKLNTVVCPEEPPQNSKNKSLVHKDNSLQSIVEKNRKDAIRRQELLYTKKKELEEFEIMFYKEMSMYDPMDMPDPDSETKCFHMVDKFRSVCQQNQEVAFIPGQTPQSQLIQKPQKQDFAILIGEFEAPKHEYLHDIVQSYYKQFVTSEQAIYFFKYPEEKEVDQQISELCQTSQRGGNQQKNSFQSSVKTGVESEVSAIDPRGQNYKPGAAIKKPILYQLNAFQNRIERVIVNESCVYLPVDINTNQFAIIRPMDPQKSRELSFLDSFMVAILKEKHIKAEPSAEMVEQIEQERRTSRRKSSKKYPPLMARLIESSVEIFNPMIEGGPPLVGSNVDLKEIPPEFDPKNISAFHKADESDEEEAKKPINEDFNFCCWYILDNKTSSFNFSLLVGKLQVLMKVPNEASEALQDLPQGIIVARNIQYNPYDDEHIFLKDFKISQDMPIYGVDLVKPINFSKLESFMRSARDAKAIWEQELASQPKKGYMFSVSDESYGQSPSSPESQYQMLLEAQENLMRLLDMDISRLYLIIKQKKNDIDFEVLYPPIPDYFWSSQDGQRLRMQIDAKILQNFKSYLESEPNYQSYKENGGDANKYQQIYKKNVVGSIPQFSQASAYKNQLGQGTLVDWVKDQINQCVYYHQIFLEELPTAMEDGEKGQEQAKFKPKQFDNYGLATFPSLADQFTSLMVQKSVKQNKKSVQTHMQNLITRHPSILKTLEPLVKGKSKKRNAQSEGPKKKGIDVKGFMKLPLASQKESQSSRLKRANTIATQICGRQSKTKNVKSKFKMEKVMVSEDQKCFIHIIKFRKMYRVQRNNFGEIIRVLYRGKYREFEEDFEYFDYEINIGWINLADSLQAISAYEERDPFKKTGQLLYQFCALDGQREAVFNPYNPFQRLLMLTDHADLKSMNQKKGPIQIGSLGTPQSTAIPLKNLQVCQKDIQKTDPSNTLEEMCQFRNLPAQKVFIDFLGKVKERREYFMDSILQFNAIREVEWNREDDDLSTCALADYINEQSMVKVWIPPQGDDRRRADINTIDVLTPIFKVYPKFMPTMGSILNCNLPPEPQSWEILRNLFIEKHCLATLKQQKDYPRNVVLKLAPRRPADTSQILEPGKSLQQFDQTVHFVGRLDEKFEKFEYLSVIRQTTQSVNAIKEFQEGKQVLKPVAQLLHADEYTTFAMEFLKQNNFISTESNIYCNSFPIQDRNTRMVAFDPNYGESFADEVELFACRLWRPYNAVRLFTFDFISKEVKQVFEVPVPEGTLEKIQDIQLVRISDEELTYALLIDWCSFKELWQIQFSVKFSNKKSMFWNHKYLDVKGKVVGKMDFLSPHLFDAQFTSGMLSNTVPTHQVKLCPLYKKYGLNSPPQGKRDGFSLLINQERLDFDYKYFSIIQERENIKYSYQSKSNIFEYEIQRSKKIKRNINPECTNDLEYFRILVVKVKLAEEILETKTYTEGQKFKLLRYFSKTIQAHSDVDYSNLYDTMITKNEAFSLKKLKRLIQPRSEFFGATILGLKCLDDDLVGQSIDLFHKIIRMRIQDREAHYQQKQRDSLSLKEAPEGPQLFMKTSDSSIVAQFIPTIDEPLGIFQQHQLEFFMTNMRFCELDLNLMSPITWAMHFKCHNVAKQYAVFFKEFAAKTDNKDMIRDHSVIFYGAIKQLIDIGIIDLEEFLNPDGIGEDIGCELFQQTLTQSYLPQFHTDSETYTNDFRLGLEALERNMAGALSIKDIVDPHRMDEQNLAEGMSNLHEVQYGLIDIDWMNILNIFDQKPLGFLALKQRLAKKSRFKLSKTSKNEAFDMKAEIKKQKDRKKPFLEYVAKYSKMDIFTYESIKLLIDNEWNYLAYEFFKMQLWVFLLFFVAPFAVDLYHSYYVIHDTTMTLTHFSFNLIALGTQFLFFLNELIQMSVKGTHILEYFESLWNFNDISFFPFYLTLQIILWTTVSDQEEEVANKISPENANVVKFFYLLLSLQTFIKLLFLLRIYDSFGFMVQMIQKIMRDLSTYFVFLLGFNVLFAVMFMILESEVGSEYDTIWGPLKWMLFVFRNALHDFQIDRDQSFLTASFPEGTTIEEQLADGNGFVLYMSWMVWFGNSVIMTILMLNLIIAIIGQSYEQFFGEMEAHIYQQRAELVVEAQQVLMWLGYFKSDNYTRSIIIRKQKFCDDVNARLDKDKWQGITFALKNFLKFCVISKIEAIEDQSELQKRRVNARLSNMEQVLSEVTGKLGEISRDVKASQKDQTGQFMDLSRSKITYNQGLNNVSQ